MNVLVIGSGGREHALCWKIKESPKVSKIYCIPGNGGTAGIAENHSVDINDHEKIRNFCEEKEVNLVVVGPEAPLARGITDFLEASDIKVCGPSYAASRLESSKIFAKELLGRYNVPTAAFRIFNEPDKAMEYVKEAEMPVVVKADGLAAGKGVIVASNAQEALDAVESMMIKKEFGSAGHKIIVEEFLQGEEVSVLVMTDGVNIVPLASSQDHKTVFDGDKGPNTGGMGAYSPAPVINDRGFEEIKNTILQPVIDGLREEGTPYKGVLYAGLMITENGPRVLEFNVRFGDPETQAILPRLKSDFFDLLNATANGDLKDIHLQWDQSECVCVVLASGGYPGPYEKGKEIHGIEDAGKEGAIIFHAGTKKSNGKILTAGGRVLNVVGKGTGIKDAVENAYKAVGKIHFENMHYRKDIGHRALKRLEQGSLQ